jgi:hypothetical protein
MIDTIVEVRYNAESYRKQGADCDEVE